MRYWVSGVSLASDRPLDGLPCGRPAIRSPRWSLQSDPGLYPSRGAYRKARLRRTPDSVEYIWPGRGAWVLHPGRRVIRYAQAPAGSWEAFLDVLLGPVLCEVLLSEGVDALHGSAIRHNGGAVAFLAEPGAGKSTIAAAFVLNGFGLLADDLLTVSWHGDRPWGLPGHPEIRLWPGSGQRLLRHSFARLPRVVPTASKRRLDPRAVPGGFEKGPLPLERLYELRRSPRYRVPCIEPMEPGAAMEILLKHRYGLTRDGEPETWRRLLQNFGRLARSVPVRRLWLPRSGAAPAALIRTVLRDAC